MDMTATKENEPEFMIGQGFVGAILLDIIAGPCLRLDDKRWSMNTGRGNLVLANTIIERLTAKGFVALSPEKMMDRDWLVLTYDGVVELQRYALWRSFNIAEQLLPPMVPLINGNEAFSTSDGVVFDLAQRSFRLREDARIVAGEDYLAVKCPGNLTVELSDKNTLGLHEYFGRAKTPGDRHALLFELIKQLADASMCGLLIDEMPTVGQWAAVIAGEAFRRAHDQDWEMDGEGGDAAEGESE